jgi:hypothetical protein
MSEADWASLKAKAIRTLQVAPGWAAPQLVAGAVNSPGWEDSASISPDGDTLTFSYIPVDLFSWTQTGPDFSQFARYRRGPGRGVTPEFSIDTLSAKREGGRFGRPETHPVSVGTDPVYQSESSLSEARDGSVWHNTNHPVTQADSDTDIYRDGRRLPFCTQENENDPDFSDGELFFWQEAADRKQLWSVRETAAGWGRPALLPAPINTPASDAWQSHLTRDGLLYFTSSREGPLGIFASRRKGPEAWDEPARVVWPGEGSAAIGVAEPSLTADGKRLYFCVLFRNPGGSYDLDIATTERLP